MKFYGNWEDHYRDAKLRRINRIEKAAPELLAICEEIANDPKCDLGDSERRIRLYTAIQKANGIK
jgi:hypothetical protein